MKLIANDSNEIVQNAEQFVNPALQLYTDFVKEIFLTEKMCFTDIGKNGNYNGFHHLSFWKEVIAGEKNRNTFLRNLVPVAALLLAQPAAEAVGESAFSAAGQTLTKFRTSMSPLTLEQVTFVKMFIRRKDFSPVTFDVWYQDQKRKHNAKEKALKEAKRAVAGAEKK